jgi:hypothetical protein
VKAKSGYEYVVYPEDGTRLDYDNREPFEIIVEKVEEYNDIGY